VAADELSITWALFVELEEACEKRQLPDPVVGDLVAGAGTWVRSRAVIESAAREESSRPLHPGAAYTDMTEMRRSDQMGMHRGTDVAVVASLVLGGWTLSMVPLGLLGMLVSPVDVPVWREALVFVGAVLVGLAMLAIVRSLRMRRPWARPVAIVVLATWTFVIGAFIFSVFRSDEGHGAVYVLLGGLQLGGLAAAGALGLVTRGAAADSRARGNDAVVPEPPPPVT